MREVTCSAFIKDTEDTVTDSVYLIGRKGRSREYTEWQWISTSLVARSLDVDIYLS